MERFVTNASRSSTTSSDNVRKHRARLGEERLRLLQVWVTDTRAPGFAEEARRQSEVVAASEHAEADQAFIDAISEFEVG
ncbi:MAG: antitoxin MazE family protein [Defluviicoccus sp.]|nr:antitoxin MazE family protein [Defluviicoccus sp.]MDE0382941.1 antitoxin MazE family protein [Defluviicoccus sp.]